MATFTTGRALLTKPAENDGDWDTTLNNNFDYIDQGNQYASISFAGGNVTLSDAQARYCFLNCTGQTAPRDLTFSKQGFYVVWNGGAYAITAKSVGGITTICPAGGGTAVFCDGASVVPADGAYSMPRTGGAFSGGITLPSSGLSVGGSELLVTGGGVYSSGNITAAGNVTAYSDRRLKTDIRPLVDATAIVEKLDGVRYKDMGGGERVGVVAQEVETVLPEVVFTDKDGVKHVAYQNMIAVLIEAVKELAARVDELEAGSA